MKRVRHEKLTETGVRGCCTKGRGWRRTLRSILELKLLERRGLAALTLAWSGRKGGGVASQQCGRRCGVRCGRLTKKKDLDASVGLELATFDFETGIDFVGYPLCFSLPSFTFCPLQESLVDWGRHETCKRVSMQV